MGAEHINKGLFPGTGPVLLELELVSPVVHALVDRVALAQLAPEVGAYLVQGGLKKPMGMCELEAGGPYGPNLRVLGNDPVTKHETPKSMEGSPEALLVAHSPVGLRNGTAGEFSDPKFKQTTGSGQLGVHLALAVVEKGRLGGSTRDMGSEGGRHQPTEGVELHLSESMDFLTIKELPVKDRTGDEPFAGPGYRKPPDAMRHSPKPLGDRPEGEVGLPMPVRVNAEVLGHSHSGGTCEFFPGSASGDGWSVDLFFGIVQKHVVSAERRLNAGKTLM